MRIAVTDPVYPVYVDTNVMAGRTERRRRARLLRRHPLPARHRGERLRAGSARRARRRRLSLLPEQPHRRRRDARAARALGGLGARRRRRADLRRRLRRLHPGPRDPALDLRDPGRRELRDRDAFLLEARRLHRRALRVHGDPERRHRDDGVRRARRAPGALGAPPGDQVQRRAVRDPARRLGGALARRQEADRRAGRVLHGERDAGSAAASRAPASTSSAACTRPTSGCGCRPA